MKQKTNQIPLLVKICTLVIVISPVFSHYGFFLQFLLLPEMLYIFLTPFCLIQIRKINLSKYKYLIAYLFMIFLLSMINGLFKPDFSFYEFATAYCRFLFYSFIIIIIADGFFNISYGAKAYIIIALLNSLYLIAQNLSYTLFQVVLPWHIRWLPIITGSKLISDYEIIFKTYGYRPQGFFLEPAYFAGYVIPALAIILFYKSPSFHITKTASTIIALVLSVALILSGSGTAIILLVVCWFFWGVNYLKEKKPQKLFLKTMIISVTILLITILLYRSPYVNGSINRVLSDGNLSSRNVRISRGFVIFEQLPRNDKIIGVGYGNNYISIDKYNIVTPYDIEGSNYTNTIAYILIGTGYIGLFFYFLIYFDLLKNTRGFFRYTTIILLLTAFSSENPLSLSMITAFAFIMKGYTPNHILQKRKFRTTQKDSIVGTTSSKKTRPGLSEQTY